jgi:hypothetical protein
MLHLTPDEARVLGVLIEKAMTTPDQYPLSQNAVVNGANQKNNRDPVITMDDNRAFDALEGLRGKALLVRVTQAGSRVDKFRHAAGDVLHARPAELALLAELMMRGPQTLGELRGRASRMSAFESLEAVKNLLEAMMTREEPLVKLLAPSPGSRAERYAQLLAPEAHPLDEGPTVSAASSLQPGSVLSLSDRVTHLEAEVRMLRAIIQKLAQSLGEADPFAENDGPSESPA